MTLRATDADGARTHDPAAIGATDPVWRQSLIFLRFVFAQTGNKGWGAILYLLLASLTEGLSVLLVLPLLGLLKPGGVVPVPLPRWIGGSVDLQLWHVLLGLVALVTGQAFFARFKNVYMTEVLQKLVDVVRLDVFRDLGAARWDFLSRQRSADLQHLMTADIDRIQSAAFNMLVLIQTIVLLAVYLVVSWFISVWMTVLAGVLGAVMLVALAPVRGRASRHGARLGDNFRNRYRTVSEFLNGLKLAKSYNAEGMFAARLEAVLSTIRQDAISFTRVSSISGVVSQVVSAAAVAVILFVGTRYVQLSAARLIVFILLLIRISPRFLSLQTGVQELLVNLPAFRTTQAMRAICRDERESPPATSVVVPPLASGVRFDRIGFGFGSGAASAAILHDLSFEIEAHRVTALIGPSGAGKSTVADLVIGLLKPGTGRILIDGVPLDDERRQSWRRQVAYVPQDVFLMHDTIGANLSLAAPEATEETMWAALEQANAARFIAALPDRLATIVGDRGARFSGGERQRIALARALLGRPSFLLLDEATSALDWENQQLIAQSLERLRGTLTILTVAHRASMIAIADRVIAIENGRIVEDGSIDTLRARSDSRVARLMAEEGAC